MKPKRTDKHERKRQQPERAITREHTAIHEAGHAVVGYVLGLGCTEVALTHDSVDETGAYGYKTGPNPKFGYHSESERERQQNLRDQCIELCAGLAAEHVFYDVPLDQEDPHAQWDFQKIDDLERDGMRIPRKRGGFVGDEQTDAFISRCLVQARRLVKHHRDPIQRLADVLLERTKLSGEEVEGLLRDWNVQSMPR